MTTVAPSRKPKSFSPDDPALVTETDALDAASSGSGAGNPAPSAGDVPLSRPTLAELGARGLNWGKVLITALAAAGLLGACASFARLIAAALAREDWVGWSVLALLAIAALAAAMIGLKEIIGFARLSRLTRLRAEIGRAISAGDRKQERRAALKLARLYASRPELAWNAQRFREHAGDVHDQGELLCLAEREFLAPLDARGRRLVTAAAKRVATVTALSPMLLIAVSYVAIENLRLLRALAGLYGGRPGIVGLLRLANMVLGHLIATGGIAFSDDLLGQFLGQDVLRRLSRRLGEGAFNGALTARVGVTALAVIRPLPFLAARAPRARDILGEVLKPMLPRGKPAPAKQEG
jgi:putative membrane protein